VLQHSYGPDDQNRLAAHYSPKTALHTPTFCPDFETAIAFWGSTDAAVG
jgi:hypothetical protein